MHLHIRYLNRESYIPYFFTQMSQKCIFLDVFHKPGECDYRYCVVAAMKCSPKFGPAIRCQIADSETGQE